MNTEDRVPLSALGVGGGTAIEDRECAGYGATIPARTSLLATENGKGSEKWW